MTVEPEIEAVVRGLTKAQRAAIAQAKPRLDFGTVGPMQVSPGGSTVAMCKKGLIAGRTVQSISGRRSRIYALTERGLRVRAHLLAQSTGHDEEGSVE